MGANGLSKATAVIVLLSVLGFLLLLTPDASGVGSSGILEIEDDSYDIQVSPDDTGTVEIPITLRSTETRNTIFDISYEWDAPSTWVVDGLSKVYLGPLEKKSFSFTIISPLGESADVSVDLDIKATVEENGIQVDGDVTTDSCTINVVPFYRASIILDRDYELDIDPQVPYPITVRNDGNIRAPIGLMVSNGSFGQGENQVELVDPGENTTFDLYIGDQWELMGRNKELFAISGEWISLEPVIIEIIEGSDLYHILFRPGPFLILYDIDPVAEENQRMQLFCIGGDVTNVGLEIVEGPPDATITTSGPRDLENLDRSYLEYEFGGISGSRMMFIRAYGFHEGKKVTSNILPIWTDGQVVETASIPVPAVVGGGVSAAVVTITGTAAYFYSASEVFKYRWLALLLVPLYSIVHDEKVLDHFFRGRLFEYIKENPGVTFTALKEHFEVNNGTLTYHLHKLEREDLITYRNLGKYKMFYADGVRIKGVEVVISPLDKEIVEIISAEPGITSSQVIALLRGGRSQRTISRHLKQLERKGFIHVERTHGARRLFISGDLERVLMPHTGVVEVAEMTTVQT
jgi:DNA-binding MarR family transcriptional regulator